MYTQTSNTGSLWFATALLPTGWANNVRIGIRSYCIASVEHDVEPDALDERHAIGIPGVANVHSHAFQRALAGLTERRAGGDSFWSWREAMYGLVAKLTPQSFEAIAAQAFVEMLESGITRVGEFHYVHHAQDARPYTNIAEHASSIAAAAAATGMGLTLLPVFYAHGGIGPQEAKPTQRRFITSLDSYARLLEASNRIVSHLPFGNVGIAAHSVRAVTPDELQTLAHFEHVGPLHVHIAEQLAEVEEWRQWAGARPVDWLLDHCSVDERWCLVHATHVSSDEIMRLAHSGAVVGLCPITEANLGDGIFPAREFLSRAGCFGIGTDSNVLIDLAEELRCLEYTQRLQHRERNVLASNNARSTGRTLFDAATLGGARALQANTGRLAPGCIADIIALSDRHPSVCERADDAILDSWIFAGAEAVDCVWSAGRKVVVEGRHRERERIQRDYVRVLGELRE